MKAGGQEGGTAAADPSTALLACRFTTLTWRMSVDAVGRPGAANMALDQALLDQVERRRDVGYLRLYRWDPPCLSFGRNEPARTRYDREAIERLGVDVVRRPTGGRAVWHEDEVTYAVAASVDALGCLRDSYRTIHRRLARALRVLGVDARLAADALRPGALAGGPCFAQPVGGEVLVGGRKVIGSAQVRQGRAFLQHGSILLGGSQDVVAQVSRLRRPAPPAGSVSQALGRRVTFDEVAVAIRDTWLEPGETARPADHSTLPAYRHNDFTDPHWTWRR